MKIKNKKKSLVSKILSSIFISILLFNVVQIFLIGKITADAQKKDDTFDYDQMVEAYSRAIESKFESYFKALDFYVKSDVVRFGTEAQIASWLKSTSEFRDEIFNYVLFCNKDGLCYTDLGTTEIASRSYYKAIFNERKIQYASDPSLSTSTKRPVIQIAKPVIVDSEIIGLICGSIDIEDVIELINRIKIGKTGYAWLLSSTGLVIAHPMEEFVMKKSFITGLSEDYKDLSAVASEISKGYVGSAWAKGFNGGKDYITYHGIIGSPWGLAISVPQQEIYDVVSLVMKQMLVSSSVIVVLLLLISGFFLYKNIKPLKDVEKAITNIASGNADLTKRIEFNSNNEIGNVVKGFNAFAGNLQSIIGDIKNLKEELSIHGEDLSFRARDTANAISQIIANINGIRLQIENQSKSVQGTAGAVNQIASNIESLDKMIENQFAGVEQASAAVEQMMGNISSINISVDKMASSFKTLQTDSQEGFSKQELVNEKIEQIEKQSAMLQEANEVISSIASQTNLLAMNAAIEAAHAGDAGKGFSVVADEIRKLSETSTIQSKTIGDQLELIQTSIESVVKSSTQSSESFRSVSKQLTITDQLVMQIKAALEEQNEGSQQIKEALHAVNESSSEVKNSSSEMSAGNKAILDEIKTLQDVTFSMKESMENMSNGAKKINETGGSLNTISSKVKSTIDKVGEQVDKFTV
ncbi:methyl-accepting chemotaxis protein [Treponema pectinovorum]|uniref:methyl-accepting chemotaxis protein n=1 Tax=Treponema pectinovorum TaxID=164 RepID=UPI003D8A8D2D